MVPNRTWANCCLFIENSGRSGRLLQNGVDHGAPGIFVGLLLQRRSDLIGPRFHFDWRHAAAENHRDGGQRHRELLQNEHGLPAEHLSEVAARQAGYDGSHYFKRKYHHFYYHSFKKSPVKERECHLVVQNGVLFNRGKKTGAIVQSFFPSNENEFSVEVWFTRKKRHRCGG